MVPTTHQPAAGDLDGRSEPDLALLRALGEVVGPSHLLVDPDLVAPFLADWSGRFHGRSVAVVRPADTGEVAGVVNLCAAAGVAVTLQGGNTGLVGGGVPLGGELVVSLRRLDRLGEVDRLAGQVTAGAGVTIERVQQAAAEAGWRYGVDLASRGSATVGGSVATNAGGVRVLRHGDTRAQLVGIEAVLGDGTVVSHLGGLVKDNTGYDLAGLLCGSEGTLAVVTAARLRLVPPAGHQVVALLAFDGVSTAVEAGGQLHRGLASLEAVELFLDEGLGLVCEVTGMAPPFDHPHRCYLLVEVAGRDPTDELAEAVASLPGVAEVAVATDPARRATLWRYREAHTEAVSTLGPPHKLDVSLPAAELAPFVERVPKVVAELVPDAQVWLFGHAADGNVHVNVTGLHPDDDRVDAAVFELVAEAGGSISAEHGIGTAKRRWLHLNRSQAEIAAFRALKSALDPAGILNPAVLLPPPG
jgi:FAD/FMN-containing dehydrogenase